MFDWCLRHKIAILEVNLKKMCGRFALKNPINIKKRFKIRNSLTIPLLPNEDVRPSQVVPVVVGDNELDLMKWGFIPAWSKDEKVGYTMINARAESVDTKPTYKKPFHFQRCLIPASGFYEWKNTPTGKVKYYFHLKSDDIFAFAGLYTVWISQEGREVRSFTIITTAPNAVVEPIHDRMPVILKKEDEDLWLNPDETESDRLLALLTPYPAKDLERSKSHI